MVSAANVPGKRADVRPGRIAATFQIIDNGRLIVGSSPDAGQSHLSLAPSMAGYSAGETKTFSRDFHQSRRQTTRRGDFASWQTRLISCCTTTARERGPVHAGGRWHPADNDGSARFGQGDGCAYVWGQRQQFARSSPAER